MRRRQRRELQRKGEAVTLLNYVLLPFLTNISGFQVEKTEGEGEEEAAEKAGGSKEGKQRE